LYYNIWISYKFAVKWISVKLLRICLDFPSWIKFSLVSLMVIDCSVVINSLWEKENAVCLKFLSKNSLGNYVDSTRFRRPGIKDGCIIHRIEQVKIV
jgi:hypothetical protein